jgi:hypothetical protein
MAKETTLLVLGGAAVAWYGYTQGWFKSFMAPAAAPACPAPGTVVNGICTCPAPNTVVAGVCTPPSGGGGGGGTAPATLSAQLTTAAGSAAQFGLTPDQWSYFYAGLPGKSPIPVDVFTNMLNKAGMNTPAGHTNPMTVDFFVGMLNSVGLSGWRGMGQVSGRGYMRAPIGAYGQFSIADFRRAGRR